MKKDLRHCIGLPVPSRIEQCLKYLVVAADDQHDLGINVPRCVRSRDPGEAGAEFRDTLPRTTGLSGNG